jgi:hypothetical protein
LFETRHYKSKGIAYCKKKERENEVGGGATMPEGMVEWREKIIPIARIID